MSIEHTIREFKLMEKVMLQRVEEILKFCQDVNSAPLQIRWDAYAQIQPHLKIQSYTWHSDLLGDISWYDDFNLERYSIMPFDNLVERVEEKNTDDGWDINIDALKEEIIATGLGGFEEDW
jgi:hypothetical protein